MPGKTHYANGQKIFEQVGDVLTYFFKDGAVKAQGHSIAGAMDGEWRFYREGGQLWQIGNFRQGQRQGSWTRYDKAGRLEYEETFVNDKKVKKKA